MAMPIIPRIIRGRLFYQTADVLFPTLAQGPLAVRLVASAESLQAMTRLAVRSLDRIEQLTGGATVETLLIQAKTLLDDARVAAEGGHPMTHDLQRQAREVIGAALDRCGFNVSTQLEASRG